MRPQQQNRRMRGRNNNGGGGNNNRKGPNPLTRNYESNGPDVKIRGSAQQIAEKYAALARDAQSSGDRVMAENYLQHAEHYNRIIAAAQAQMPIQNAQQNRDDFDDDVDEDRDEFDAIGNTNAGEPQAAANGSGPQPVIEGTPAEPGFNQENGRDNNRRDNNGRDRHRDRRNGGYGQYGQNGQRDGGQRAEGQRGEHGGQQFDQNRRSEAQAQPEASAEGGSASEEPAPVFDSFSPAGLAAQAERNEAATDNGGGRRQRRPRRGRGSAEQGYSAEQGNVDESNAGRADSPADDGNAADKGNDAVVTAAEEAKAAPSESVASEPAGGTGEPAVADANN
ncbi:MAG: DUF4167 domain-containing protein [Mesorhizobium sp.]|uniref:DUF4167 domain-containing protein n=2 Tax=Mesorhizobium sp. TaxID=1871066 RepID=UPI000FE44380|nr:DUF4167 domain-containing protein [Mesorhizobium sp.]RWA71731.1 MAG: DUF4167 domain-containing protein [Mesorhizobium sp.]RWC01027.1 MAG: DUF4167 domain-containing protein [Mesorhizobium sp.]RWG76828.1 MAG: DUF4167 domain-containing protein [Mesorhizobium sp.]RWG88809.1 MAG: DUF4167 domain-containing protein [Mesorhizobium sp.]RWK09143.1 MAG: DUF4167 domain-containing protein [Mesorhizobium sp.]